MSDETKSEVKDRQQIAELMRKVVADSEFRQAFQTDPRAAIASSGIELAPQTIEQVSASVSLVPSVAFHTDASDVSAFFFFALHVD
jgi:hypothetical protein